MGTPTPASSQVEYSLNKKGRFRFLEHVRGVGIVELNETSKVSAIERIAHAGRANVIGYHGVDDEGREIHRAPSAKTFSGDLNPQKAKPPKKLRKKKVATFRRHSAQRPGGEEPPAEGEEVTTYEFVHPNTSLARKDQYSAMSIRKPRLEKLELDDFQYDDEDFNEHFEDDVPRHHVTMVNIVDFIVPNVPKLERRSRKKERVQNVYPSRSFSVESAESEQLDDEPETSQAVQQLRYFDMPAVEATIFSESLEPAKLEANYGDKYYECACVPRRICVNISTAVRNVMVVSHGVDFVQRVDDELHVLCVVEVQPLVNVREKVDGDHFSFCQVWLNGNFESDTPLGLESIDAFGEYTVDEILTSAAKMIGTIPAHFFKLSQKTAQSTCSKSTKVMTLDESLNRLCTAYADLQRSIGSMESDKATMRALFETKQTQRLQRQITTVQKFMERRQMSVSMRVCVICLCETEDTWALAVCHHWFCKQCWLDYACAQIRRGSHLIKCPAFDCSSILNYDMLCTVAPLPLCLTYANIVRDEYMQSHHNEMTWCVNPRCNRVISFRAGSSRDAEVTLSCDACGFAWCSSCKGNPHWPATCEQVELYREKLKKMGDDTRRPHDDLNLDVKRCPHCNLRMEKGGGCNHMTCRCGSSFQWNKQTSEKVRLVDVINRHKGRALDENIYNKCVAHHKRLFENSLRTLEQLFRRGIVRSLATARTADVRLDNVSDAAHTLLRAYKQTHYLLEFTYVYMYYAPAIDRLHRARIGDAAERLAFASSMLEQCCVEGDGEKTRHSIPVVYDQFNRLVTVIKAAKRTPQAENPPE